MPRYYKRRRRNKRRNTKWETYLYTMKKLYGKRTFRGSDTRTAYENTQNLTQFRVVSPGVNKGDVEAYLAMTTGNDAKQLGLGTYTTDKYNYRWYFHHWIQMFTFRNISEHPCFFTIYELVAKTDRALLTTGLVQSVKQTCIDDLHDGWYDTLGGTTDTAVQKDGINNLEYSPGNDFLETWSWNMHLKDSKYFMHNWKVVNKRAYKLNSGDDVKWAMKSRKFIWDPSKLRIAGGSDNNELDIFSGLTKVLMIKFTGTIGRSNVANEDAVVGFMQADVYSGVYTNLAVTRLNHEASDILMLQTNMDDLATKTMIAPSDEAMVDDQN